MQYISWCSTDTPREYIQLLGLDMEAVEARLGRLLKPAANRKQQQQPEQLLLNDLSLEPTTISSAASGDDHNLDDFEMIAMTAEETKNLPTALDSSFRWDTAGLWIQICFNLGSESRIFGPVRIRTHGYRYVVNLEKMLKTVFKEKFVNKNLF